MKQKKIYQTIYFHISRLVWAICMKRRRDNSINCWHNYKQTVGNLQATGGEIYKQSGGKLHRLVNFPPGSCKFPPGGVHANCVGKSTFFEGVGAAEGEIYKGL